MKNPKCSSYYASILMILACIAILIVPSLTRDSLAGEDAYFNLRISGDISKYDGLSYGGRFAAYSFGLPAVLAIYPDIMAYILPLLLGLISFLIFWMIIRKFDTGNNIIAGATILLSPAFIYTFSTLNRHSFPLCLGLLGIYLAMGKGKKSLLAIPIFLVIPFFSMMTAIISGIIASLFVFFSENEKKSAGYAILASTFAVSGAIFAYFAINSGFEKLLFEYRPSGFNGVLQNLFSDLGSMQGLSIFSFILAFIGIVSTWKLKYHNKAIFFSGLLLSVLMIFRIEAVLLMSVFIAAFAGKGADSLLKRTWQSKAIKNILLITFACGIIFSGVSEISRMSDSVPSSGMMEGINFLRNKEQGTTFSEPSRGFFIAYSGHKNVMDTNFYFAPNANERWDDTQRLLHTREWKVASEIIKKYDIDYIWIDNDMKSRIWGNDEDGLLFLLKYSNAAKKAYYTPEVQIWEMT